MDQKPVGIGLLVCEQVIIEEATRNVTPVNCFTKRTVTKVPSETVPFVVFAILTNGSGEMPLDIIVQRLDTLDVVYKIRSRYHFANPLHEVRCVVRIRDCTFPVAGYYQVQLLSENEPIAQKKFLIVTKENSA